jgi:hypothetical protein
MESIPELMAGLREKNTQIAYDCLKRLLVESEQSSAVYPYFDDFVSMLENDNSYLRTRGLFLIAANARWDTEQKLGNVIDEYLSHIHDEKPITARQCIQTLPALARDKPEYRERIIAALKNADTSKYQETMQPLIWKDIVQSLAKIGPA